MSSKLLKGTFILTLGMVLSKVIGLFYVIPFNAIVGYEGVALYQYSYVVYSIFISLATGGMPLAVSKFVSKYNAMGEFAIGQKLFKASIKLMMLTGFLAFLAFWFLAPAMAGMMANEKGIPVEDIVTVMRSVSFALILVPVMSMIRGYFQGNEYMTPSSVSMVIEQVVRIVVLLGGALVVMYFLDGDVVKAISVATFAAFVGAAGGLAVLFLYWRKQRAYFRQQLEEDKGTIDLSLPSMYKEIILYSIPFVFVGIAMSLFQLVDQLTFSKAMKSIGIIGKEADTAIAILNVYAQKLVIIPMTLATGFSMAIVPSITKAFVEDKPLEYKQQLDQAFQVLIFLTLPAVVGMSLLAEPIYSVFYGHNELGVEVLKWYAPTAILFAFFSVTAAVLQGINQQRYTVLSLLFGLLVKLSLNIPLIEMFETLGSVFATTLGYLAATMINFYVIHHYTGYKYNLMIKRTVLMGVFTAIMAAVVWGFTSLFGLFLEPTARFQAIIIIIIGVLSGVLVYAALALKSKLAHRLFGTKVDALKEKLGL
ncbi:MAG: oligosaccharide flippase family protein [Bacillus sp. (in: firmicutes)]